MSSFICSPKHFNSVEKAIQGVCRNQRFHFDHEIRKMYPYLSGDISMIDAMDDTVSGIMDEIRKLSVLCVCLQYRHHYEGTLNIEIEQQTGILINDKANYKKLGDIELYIAVQCIDYQIETEHLTDIRPLSPNEEMAYRFLRVFECNLAKYIVSRLPEYEKAGWAIE